MRYTRTTLTDLPSHGVKEPADNKFNAFDICEEYQDFFNGKITHETSPFVPVINEPSTKFIKILSYDTQRILAVAIYSRCIEDILHQISKSHNEIEDINLFTPSGISLRDPLSRENHSQKDGSSEEIKTLSVRVPSTVSRCCQCVQKGLSTEIGNYEYNLKIKVSTRPLREARRNLLRVVVFTIAAATVASRLAARFVARTLVERINKIRDTAKAIVESGDLRLQVSVKPKKDEIADLVGTFNTMLTTVRLSQEKLIESEKVVSIARVASQVAHDIRSPLAAIRMALADLAQPSEETRSLLRSASLRIEDIANQLLQQRKHPQSNETNESSPILLSSLIEIIASEKRIQYREQLGLEITAQMNTESYGLFSSIRASDLQRILSNVINNAADSLSGVSGAIVITLIAVDERAIIRISDNGKGMPPHILSKISQQEVTYGKKDGNGVGIYGSKLLLDKSGGTIHFDSTINVGTTVTISLATTNPPTWFLSELVVNERTVVVVIDDDVSIHGIWTERFRRAQTLNKILHFSSTDAFGEWHKKTSDISDHLFLFDYEFLGHEKNGIDVIENLDIIEKSVLTTSRFEDPKILGRCVNLGLKMVPKPAAAQVPLKVSLQPKDAASAVLIDNDALVRRLWRQAAMRKGIMLKTFGTVDGFRKDQGSIPIAAVVYLDSHLDNGVRGEDEVLYFRQRGHKKIYLATGGRPSDFKNSHGIDGVIGKHAPF